MTDFSDILPLPPRTTGGGDAEQLFVGITLQYLDLRGDVVGPRASAGSASASVLRIDYCAAGRLCRRSPSGSAVYLGPKDFSICTEQADAADELTLPGQYYRGIAIRIDLDEAAKNPPEILDGAFRPEVLRRRYGKGKESACIAGDEKTEQIFSAFFGKSSALRRAYGRVKTAELLLYLCENESVGENRLTGYQSEQIETVRRVHAHLTEHLDRRCTIEELSREFLMNPTTLKTLFKSVYGNSLAAHIKEHRIEEAARLLRETDLSVSEIARRVGYDSQSKFTTAFKSINQVLPSEYRRRCGTHGGGAPEEE